MLDEDIAVLYEVEVKVLNQAVRRNIERFPDDFMFQLTREEAANLRSQIVTSSLRSQSVTLKGGRGQHRKYPPYAFTEQGVAMLSSVLRSQRAVQVNIEIMRPEPALERSEGSGCARCSRRMLCSRASLTRWSRSMMRSSKWYSTPYAV